MSRESIDGRASSHYGRRDLRRKLPTKYDSHGGVVVQLIQFKYDDLPAASENDAAVLIIPSGSLIRRVELHVLDGFAGGTSYDIGLQEPDGTEVDNDGLVDGVTQADLASSGDKIVCESGDPDSHNGALINENVSEDSQVVVAETGSFTSGEALLRIEYIPAYNRASS